VALQEVRWTEGDNQPAEDYTFFYGNGNAKLHLGTGFFIHTGIILAVKKVQLMLRAHQCDVIVLNVHASKI